MASHKLAMNYHRNTGGVASALNSALKFVSEHFEHTLYPLNSFRVSPDYYVLIASVAWSAKLASLSGICRILRFVLKRQNENGSWPEILAFGRSEENSVVFTASVGCKLVDFTEVLDDNLKAEVLKGLERAARFVVSCEIEDGWFKKSENVSLDTINVNALCSLFLIKCYNLFGRSEFRSVSLRGVKRVVRAQSRDGELLYYTRKPRTPSMFYHVLTVNFLTQFHDEYPQAEVLRSAIRGGLWVKRRQTSSGRLLWRHSLDHWSYRKFVTYPLAMEMFARLSKLGYPFERASEKALGYILHSQTADGSFPVQDSIGSLNAFVNDVRNAVSLIHEMPPSWFLLSLFRSARMVLYRTKGPFDLFFYPLLNAGRGYFQDRLLSTVETVDQLIRHADAIIDYKMLK